MFKIIKSNRKRYPYEVTWNGGRTYCRTDELRDAQKIADSLNRAKDLDAPLTKDEIEAVNRAVGQ